MKGEKGLGMEEQRRQIGIGIRKYSAKKKWGLNRKGKRQGRLKGMAKFEL